MAQGKFDVVVREMQRTAMDLLGISELHWVGMGHLKSGGHTMFYSGNDYIERNGIAILCGKTLAQCVLGYNPISDRIISVRLQGRSINTPRSFKYMHQPQSLARMYTMIFMAGFRMQSI